MADWGGISRAVEEGLLDDISSGSSSGGGLQGLAEALTGQDFSGFKVRDIFDKDRWSRRERVNQGRRLEETGIPDYTYDYNPRDQAVTTGLGPDNSPVATPIGDPNTWGDSPQKNTIDPAVLSQLRREPAWTDKPSQSMGIQDRFGDRTFSPRGRTNQGIAGGRQFGSGTQMDMSGVTGYLPGRMSVGEARRARAMRNMSRRDRAAAGLGDLERFDEFGRISGQFDERMGRMKDKLRDWDIEDRTKRPGIMGGGPSTRIQPNWEALEEDMARRAMAETLMGRDEP